MKKSEPVKEIKTTGQLRQLLANAIKGVINGDLEVEDAIAVHKLSKNVTESLYSETKIAMFHNQIGREVQKLGSLSLGDDGE